MRPSHRHAALVALLAVALTGCRIDSPATEAAPEGYHRMADGTLMADVAPDMEIVYRDIMGDGVLLPTYEDERGRIILGRGALHNHASADPSSLPVGVQPVLLRLPRTGTVATVVATSLDDRVIEGPPVAADLAWLRDTRQPGEIGPAVIGGVRELDGEPGALAGIETVVPGDEFLVAGTEGEQLVFVVDEVGPVPVAERDAAVFGFGEPRPELRLVAWWLGASDDADAADYVVRAHLVTDDA